MYNAIRVFIAAYVWMTGFGNFSYYYKTSDFSIGRWAIDSGMQGCSGHTEHKENYDTTEYMTRRPDTHIVHKVEKPSFMLYSSQPSINSWTQDGTLCDHNIQRVSWPSLDPPPTLGVSR